MSEKTQMKLDKINLKNFATFEDQNIHFDDQLNTIVGETGSGKSLILDAIQIVLGARTDKKLVRFNCEFSILEAHFVTESSFIKNYFNEIGYPFENNEIVIKRIMYSNGKSKSFLNHQSCTKTTLSDFSRRFVDLVGQFENQKLLSSEYQILLLDHYSGAHALLHDYKESYAELTQLRKKHTTMVNDNLDLFQKLDYINFQISEFEKINPSIETENDLLAQKEKFLKVQENIESIKVINQIFEGDESSSGIFDLINKIKRSLDQGLLDEDHHNKLATAEEYLNDVNYKLNNANLDVSEDYDYDQIMHELDLYQKLKRKYQVDTDQLQTIHADFIKSRDEILSYDQDLTLLEKSISSLEEECQRVAQLLHDKRETFSAHLSSELTDQIRLLKMNGATIDIKVEKTKELSSTGFSLVKFTAETNPGEGYYLIKNIASGGELSRILLGLRTILSSKDSISIFLFDEIDTGIGGETALAVGQALQSVANESQVIAISHLPQIAYFANHLVKVTKNIVENDSIERTISMVQEFTGDTVQAEVQTMNPLQ